MSMILAIAPMRVEARDRASSERRASHRAVEVIEALPAAAHERPQDHRRVLIKGCPEHGRDRQDNVPIDDALMERFTYLVDPVIGVDFGTPQAQGRFTTHRHQVLPLTAMPTAVFNMAHLVRVPAGQHLGHQAIIIGCLVARMGLRKCLPVISTDLLEDTPGP